jgi:Flp pilus assembly protein TadG
MVSMPFPSLPLARFRQNQSAAVLPTFAVGLLVVVGAVGAAIDYGRAAATRTAMQSALDATALMLSKEAETLPPETINAKANAYFAAEFQRPAAKDVQVTTAFTVVQPGSFKLEIAASAAVNSLFMSLFGYQKTTFAASTEVAWGIKKLELALALDNTGSMAQSGKLAALKTASHNLLNTLKDAAKVPGDVKIAIIPFDKVVKIGAEYKIATWVDWTENVIQPTTWTGCVEDRSKPHDVQDTLPLVGNVATLFPAVTCGALASAVPLSEDWDALHAKVDQMTAAGNTNVTIGLVWAWHALTPSLPFTQGAEPASDREKVIVLLTDGENTQNRWTRNTAAIDERTSLACANVKAAQIKLYTVRVIDGNVALLRGCATKPDMFYNIQDASQLDAVFKSIAQDLAQLRLSK